MLQDNAGTDLDVAAHVPAQRTKQSAAQSKVQQTFAFAQARKHLR
jgi:hypothetical protein